MAQLVELQADLYDQLAPQNPEIQKVEKLHATIMYLKPARLLELMRKHIDREIKAENLYPHLMEALSMLIMFSKPSEAPVRIDGLDVFSDDGSIMGATLGRNSFSKASFGTREEVIFTMRQFGMTRESASCILQDEPSLEWALGPSVPHISLLRGVRNTFLSQGFDLPEYVVFDGVNIGSAVKSPTEPKDLLWWHLRGLPGDPLRPDDSPEYKK